MAGVQASSPGEGELARRQDNGSSVSRSRRPRFRETVLGSKTVLGLTYVPSIDPSIDPVKERMPGLEQPTSSQRSTSVSVNWPRFVTHHGINRPR